MFVTPDFRPSLLFKPLTADWAHLVFKAYNGDRARLASVAVLHSAMKIGFNGVIGTFTTGLMGGCEGKVGIGLTTTDRGASGGCQP